MKYGFSKLALWRSTGLRLSTETGLQETFARSRLYPKLAAREMGKEFQEEHWETQADSITKANSQGWAGK